MSDSQSETAAPKVSKKAKVEPTPAPAPTPSARTVAVTRLIAESQSFLGVPSHVAAGGLHRVEQTELTVDEARQAIDAWLAGE